jgi:hypothetical protein
MKCEYSDGVRIEYSGSLSVRKGTEICGYLAKKDAIPESFRYELDTAVRGNNCGDLRKIAMAFAMDCGRVCLK